MPTHRVTSICPLSILRRIQLDNIDWEVVDKWNAGVDFGILNDKVLFTVDLYKNVTNNLLQKGMKLPTSTGFSKLEWFNSGKMTNRGWEFRVDLNDIVKTKDWRFTFSFNISQNENKVNEFPSNLDMETYEFGNGNYAYLIMAGNPPRFILRLSLQRRLSECRRYLLLVTSTVTISMISTANM